MGNYIFRSPLIRKNMNNMLMILPQWILPVSWRQDRPLALPNIEESYILPSNTSYTEEPNMLLKQQMNKRRMTFTCSDANAMYIKTLTDEIKTLKEIVATLVGNSILAAEIEHIEKNDDGKEVELQDNWKRVHNEENCLRKLRRCRSFIEANQNLENDNKDQDPSRPNLKNVLKDLGNVKLRPVTSSTPKFVPENDLRDILSKRFSAMHSPMYSNRPASYPDNGVNAIISMSQHENCHNDIFDSDCDDATGSFEQ